MGSLHDELKKWFGGTGRRAERADKATQAAPTPKPVEPHQGSDWKRGVTPIAPAKARDEARAGIRPMLGLPKWARRGEPSNSIARNEAKPLLKQGTSVSRAATDVPSGRNIPVAQPQAQSARKEEKLHAASLLRFGSARQPFLSRELEFKDPESWVADGAALQAPEGGKGRVLPVRIGVDFGTAYTKIAIRVADKVFFVPWSGTRNSDVPYLLPGELCRLENDSLSLGRSASAAEVRSDLKLPFLSAQTSTPEQQIAAMAFLALAIRYARAWLYRTQGALVGGANAGMGTESRLSYEFVVFWDAEERV